MKLTLILRPDEFTSFTSFYLEDFWRLFFDICIYDEKIDYDKRSSVFVIWYANADDEFCKRKRNQGYKVVIDNTWELPVPEDHRRGYYWIQLPACIWHRFNEPLWLTALGYDQYRPNKQLEYKAFLQMRLSKPHRDLLFENLQSLLPTMLWSYGDRRLPNDALPDDPHYQRYMHPSWYDKSFCTMVAETTIDHLCVSEKTYKPIAYEHPFLIFSVPGHLEKLKEYGFVTFDNLFDESYDRESDPVQRCKILAENLFQIEFYNYDQETLRRLKHNREHFYDHSLAKQKIFEQVVQPLIEYVET